MDTAQHDAEILDQFTRQAEPFMQRHAHSNEALLQLMLDLSGVGARDSVVDLACGPGIVSCFFARHARSVTGLDFVPAMLERARKLQAERGLTNLEWKQGQVAALPFPDWSFDCVITRFSFHHFLEPAVVVREMKRVCRPKGTVLVADVTPAAAAQEAFNHWEILRDPSHTRALTREELETVGKSAGLTLRRVAEFRLEMGLEDLLGGSFPKPGDADRIRILFKQDIQEGTGRLGVAAFHGGSDDPNDPNDLKRTIRLSYPVSILAWTNPG
jgi:ubiquinone/menaquinone biosynthesis C-methylase UbiE